MLVLLPPSETKRPGGDGPMLDLASLALPSLRDARETVVAALVALSSDEDEAARVLKISAKRRHEIADNAAVRTAPTMPAIDRYTGVLFDALDAASLDAASRSWLGEHVLIQSAPFGPVGALDGIPPYRLAAGTSLPGARLCGGSGRMPFDRRGRSADPTSSSTCARRRTRLSGRCRRVSPRPTCGS